MARRAIPPVMWIAGTMMTWVSAAGMASAAGFQLRELSSDGMGTAMAGSSSRADDLSTIFLNPAGMMRLDTGVQGDLAYIMPKVQFSGSGTGPTGIPFSGGDGGDAGEDKLIPALYGLWKISPDFALGLSVNVPFGLATKYNDGWVGRYFALESEISTVVVTPSIAWQATEQLSIGAGIQIGRADATLSRAINLSPLGLPDAKSELTGDDVAYGFTLGALYQFTPETRVGVSYRSRMKYSVDGSVSFSGVPAPVAAMIPTLRDGAASAEVTLPDVLSIGAYHEFSPQWSGMAELSWTNWSTFRELRVSFADGRPDDVTAENWKDSVFFSLGAEYRPWEGHAFQVGLAYDQSPVPDGSRTARIPDADRYWLSLGYAYDFSANSRLHVGYTHIFFDKVDLAENTSAGSLSGSYDGSADILSASIQLRF